MKTYQDLMDLKGGERAKADFVRSVISEHKTSDLYQTALVADEYDRGKNRTMMQFQKLLYTMSGQAVPDNYSANYKITSGFFHRFVLQETQFLLGNGVIWSNKETQQKVGEDFDTRLQELGKKALVGGVAFGFYNLDHIEVFSVLEFAPLYDEEDGALKSGVRFWQIAPDKPLRATLYEMDGYTDYIWRKKKSDDVKGEILHPKRPYIIKVRETKADGAEIYDFENYPSFPIVPLWANTLHQSELVPLREKIDAYDLISSGYANDVDDASQIYWTIQNAGGMDDVDLAKFLERMRVVHAAVVEDDGARAESHTLHVPFEAREAVLTRLTRDLYNDSMCVDTREISGGAVTATQIKAAYEPLNIKCDDFEYCVLDFLKGVMYLAGITNDRPTFTRSIIVNAQEAISNVISAYQFLDMNYVTEKVLNILGDGDKSEAMIAKLTQQREQAREEAALLEAMKANNASA